MSLDGVLAGPEKRLDVQVLFDPFEEQLHLPTASVELGNRQSRNNKIVREEHESMKSFLVDEADATQRVWKPALGVKAGEHNRLVET